MLKMAVIHSKICRVHDVAEERSTSGLMGGTLGRGHLDLPHAVQTKSGAVSDSLM